MRFPVVVEYDPETKSYTGTVPGLPIVVDANSHKEAVKLAKEAIAFIFEDSDKTGDVPHRVRPGRARVVMVEVHVPAAR